MYSMYTYTCTCMCNAHSSGTYVINKMDVTPFFLMGASVSMVIYARTYFTRYFRLVEPSVSVCSCNLITLPPFDVCNAIKKGNQPA